jgi:hypothetical protein
MAMIVQVDSGDSPAANHHALESVLATKEGSYSSSHGGSADNRKRILVALRANAFQVFFGYLGIACYGGHGGDQQKA